MVNSCSKGNVDLWESVKTGKDEPGRGVPSNLTLNGEAVAAGDTANNRINSFNHHHHIGGILVLSYARTLA